MVTRGWSHVFFLLAAASIWGSACSPAPELEPLPAGNYKKTSKGLPYKIIETANLPKLTTEVTHPVPGGPFNTRGPANWKETPTTHLQKDQVLGFNLNDSGTPPQIVIHSVSWKDHGIPLPIAENLDIFYEKATRQIAAELAPGEPLIEDYKLLLIAGRPWVRCVRHFTFNVGTVKRGERQVLKTVEGDRLYTIELRVAPDKIPETRDQAYSMAATFFDAPAEKPAEAPMPNPAK